MHKIMSKKFYLGPKFGTLFNKKWITISELLHALPVGGAPTPPLPKWYGLFSPPFVLLSVACDVRSIKP
jgi:hypothetical protein